jgi:outer membrane receptor protein involved in Fe transport
MRQGIHSRIQQVVLATAVVCLGPAALVWAQGEGVIRGQVAAAADRSAIVAATITLTSQTTGHVRESRTDEAGRFVFQVVTPGEYVLASSADGFTPHAVTLSVEPRELKTVTLSLDLRAVQASVEVTGEMHAVTSTHSPSSTVLTFERLGDMPVSQHQSLPDAIVTAAPGMIRGHDDFVHIRGHEVALNPMINGVSFWENPHTLFSSGLSPMIIETVNVMTGGFPAEYGNRFGGVLDIVTKSGLRMQNDGSIAVSAGEAGRRTVSGEFGGHRGRFGYYMFGSLFDSDRFLSPPDPQAIHDSGRAGRGFFQVDGNLGNGGALRIVVMGDGANFEIPKHPRDLQLRPLANAEQRTRQQSAIVGWTRAWSNTLASASAYQRWSTTTLSPAAGPLTAAAEMDRKLTTAGGKVDITRFGGRHAVKLGVDAVRLRPEESLSYNYAGFRDLTHLLGWPHIHVTGGVVSFAGEETGSQVSAYIQDAMQLGDRLSLDAGLRIDRYDLLVSATHASPRLNLAVQVGGNAVIHASYNHFFVPPPVEGVLSSNAGLTSQIREIGVALPGLEPTTEDQFELGASKPVGPFRVAITGYYRATDNPIHTTVWPDSRIYSYASFDRARAYGLETKAEIPGLIRYGVTGHINYALGRVNFYNPVTGGFVTEAAHITESSRFLAPMDQTHTLTAGATYRHTGTGVWVGTMMEYGSGTPMGHGDGAHEHGAGEAEHGHAISPGGASRVPGHFTANLSFGLELLRDGQRRGRVSVQFDAENITDNAYLIAQEGEFSPAQYSAPRLISASVKFRF